MSDLLKIFSLQLDTPPQGSTLRALQRAEELAQEADRLERAEKKAWYTNIGGLTIKNKPAGAAVIMTVREGGQETPEQRAEDQYYYLPRTTREAALRARELEIEARKADYERSKSRRFTWIGGRELSCLRVTIDRMVRLRYCFCPIERISLSPTSWSSYLGKEGSVGTGVHG